MKILFNIQRAFTVIGFLPKSHEKAHRAKCVDTTSLVLILIMILYEVSCVIYVVLRAEIGDYVNCLNASTQAMCVLPTLFGFCTMLYHKDKIRDVIAGFQKIFNYCNVFEQFCSSEIPYNPFKF